MASTYVHLGDVKEVPGDAPLALKFIQSYVPALDGPSHEVRHRHFFPFATIKTNNDAPIMFSSMDKMFEMRDQMTSSFFHVVNRIYVVSDPQDREVTTVLLDWTSTTYFKEDGNKPAVVPQFSVMILGKAEEGKGVFGLWVESLENWMDVSPVKAVRDEILARAAPKQK